MTYSDKPFEGCYWLKPGLLLAGELPSSRDRRKAIEKLTSLQKAGIKTILNLLSDEDFGLYRSIGREAIADDCGFTSLFPDYRPALAEITEEGKPSMTCIRFPITDMSVPSVPQMAEILDTIDRELNQNRPVYFHCYAGIGRTGTVAGCWLKRHQIGGENKSLIHLHQIRMDQGLSAYGPSPETEEQREFVRKWPVKA